MNTASIIPAIPGDFEQVTAKIVGSPHVERTVKSPLRYPGGKSRAVKTIREYIPTETKKLCAPFLGGASVELACAADGIKVYGADAFEPVVNFWKHARSIQFYCRSGCVNTTFDKAKVLQSSKGIDDLKTIWRKPSYSMY